MRWLLDQGLPRGAAAFLNSAGHDAIHIGDIGMAAAADAAILAHAVRENRVVVTLDADFHSLMALSGAIAPSVIRIRDDGRMKYVERKPFKIPPLTPVATGHNLPA